MKTKPEKIFKQGSLEFYSFGVAMTVEIDNVARFLDIVPLDGGHLTDLQKKFSNDVDIIISAFSLLAEKDITEHNIKKIFGKYKGEYFSGENGKPSLSDFVVSAFNKSEELIKAGITIKNQDGVDERIELDGNIFSKRLRTSESETVGESKFLRGLTRFALTFAAAAFSVSGILFIKNYDKVIDGVKGQFSGSDDKGNTITTEEDAKKYVIVLDGSPTEGKSNVLGK